MLCNHPQALAPGIVERPSSAHPGEGEVGSLRAAKPSPRAFSSAASVWARYRPFCPYSSPHPGTTRLFIPVQ